MFYWKYTDTEHRNIGGNVDFRSALIDELDQLNKTLQVIASNQERQTDQVIKAALTAFNDKSKKTIKNLDL